MYANRLEGKKGKYNKIYIIRIKKNVEKMFIS